MKTKDGRAAYGTGKCECQNPRMKGKKICERCDRIQKLMFKDRSYAGVCVIENPIENKHGEADLVHSWRVGSRKFIDNEDNF